MLDLGSGGGIPGLVLAGRWPEATVVLLDGSQRRTDFLAWAVSELGWSDRVGQISPGRFGDLIAVQGDPLRDISELTSVDVVIKGGLAFKLPRATALSSSGAGR